MADFIEPKAEPKPEPETKEPETIKVGDTEFEPEELQGLVDLGKRTKEWEDKAGDELDNLKSTFGKRGQTIGDLKKKVEELEAAQKEPEPVAGQEQTFEQQQKQVIDEARKYGLVDKEEATKMFDEHYQQRRSGERILAKTRRVIRTEAKDGKPKVSEEKLLEFMSKPENPKDPEKAYKLMFEEEIDQWKEKRLSGTKKTALVTEGKPTAGGKEPEALKVTKDNLGKLMFEKIQGE